jgi:hypothetical protein
MLELGLPWLWEQRNLHRADSRELSAQERLAFQGYYGDGTLDRVRLATVERISNPSFYSQLQSSGYPTLDVSFAAGMAFVDCVVVRRSINQDSAWWRSLLFHELVHVVQFEVLGPERHLELYLRGWMENGYRYDSIPFEEQARQLEARFNGHEPPFPVREAVETGLAELL